MRRIVTGLACVGSLAACSAEEAEPAVNAEEARLETAAEVATFDDTATAGASRDAAVQDPVETEPAEATRTSPPGRIVDCLVVTNSDDYEGPCRFFADDDGSFSLSLEDESTMVGEVTMVSVSILEPGHADVRGLTTSGINSRWGPAMRDAEDRACWNGSDFTICAY